MTSRNQAALGDDRSDPPGGCEFGLAGRTASLIAELRGHPVRDRRRPLMPSRRSIGPNGHHVAGHRCRVAPIGRQHGGRGFDYLCAYSNRVQTLEGRVGLSPIGRGGPEWAQYVGQRHRVSSIRRRPQPW